MQIQENFSINDEDFFEILMAKDRQAWNVFHASMIGNYIELTTKSLNGDQLSRVIN